MNELIINIAGWMGGTLIMLAYILLSLKKTSSNSIVYHLINLAGALLLIVNTIYYTAYPSTAINVIWIGVAIVSIYKIKTSA